MTKSYRKIVSTEFFSTAIFRENLRKIRKQRGYTGAGEKRVLQDNKEDQRRPGMGKKTWDYGRPVEQMATSATQDSKQQMRRTKRF